MLGTLKGLKSMKNASKQKMTAPYNQFSEVNF